jgi:hypothetical protein
MIYSTKNSCISYEIVKWWGRHGRIMINSDLIPIFERETKYQLHFIFSSLKSKPLLIYLFLWAKTWRKIAQIMAYLFFNPQFRTAFDRNVFFCVKIRNKSTFTPGFSSLPKQPCKIALIESFHLFFGFYLVALSLIQKSSRFHFCPNFTNFRFLPKHPPPRVYSFHRVINIIFTKSYNVI